MTTDERLARLERTNRQLWASLGAMTLIGVLGAAQARKVPDVIEARQFVVVGPDGKDYARLGAEGTATMLAIYDAKGTTRIMAGTLDDGSSQVACYDEARKGHAGLGVRPGEDPYLLTVNRKGVQTFTTP